MKIADILSHQFVQMLLGRYQALNAREQKAVKSLLVFLIIVLLFYLLIMPLQSYSEHAKQRYEKSAEDLVWMKTNASSHSLNSVKRNPNESLLGLAGGSAKKYYISFKRYESLEEGALRVNLERVLFKNLVLWLEHLEKQYGVRVSKISIEQQDTPAYVNARIVLKG